MRIETPSRTQMLRMCCSQCRAPASATLVATCNCLAPLEIAYPPETRFELVGPHAEVGRYDEFLPLPPDAAPSATLGEQATPLIKVDGCLVKCEHLNPTGSFKDRIASLACRLARSHGITGWVGSSAGNAGVAFAAYGARAGLAGELFVPPAIRPEVSAMLEAYGTRVRIVEGFLTDPATDRAIFDRIRTRALRRNLLLAITARSFNTPAMEGAKTISYELVEQLGEAPQAVYVPVGGGGLIASMWEGFRDWRARGLITRTPKMVAIQPSGCDPVNQAFYSRAVRVTPHSNPTSTIPGLGLPAPPDGDLALQAVRESGGYTISIPDEHAFEEQRRLASRFGLLVEPAAAAAYAGFVRSPMPGAVVVLTGRGTTPSSLPAAAQPPTVISISQLETL